MGVSNEPHDVVHLVARLERTITNNSQVPKALIADAGYWSEDNAKACEQRGVDRHIATGQPPPPIYGPPPKNLDAKNRVARKLRKKKGKEIYSSRKMIVEPVFGQAKERPDEAFPAARAGKSEWGIVALGHNAQPQQALAPPEEAPAPGGVGHGVMGGTPPNNMEGYFKRS
jgi:hypothetical protein